MLFNKVVAMHLHDKVVHMLAESLICCIVVVAIAVFIHMTACSFTPTHI